MAEALAEKPFSGGGEKGRGVKTEPKKGYRSTNISSGIAGGAPLPTGVDVAAAAAAANGSSAVAAGVDASQAVESSLLVLAGVVYTREEAIKRHEHLRRRVFSTD
jgi:hypothetical protein